jgi:hypothetical protein
MEGIFRIIKLLIDPKSARDLEKDGQEALDKGTDPKKPTQNLKVVENAMARVKKAAVALNGAILAAFSVRAIQSYVQSAISASFDLEASRNRLAVALRNEGIELAAVNSQLQEFTRNLWETHRLTEGEVNPILQQLITITGDYDLSLRGVGIAADLAAATQMDTVTAARLVGRVLKGETSALRRYGIVIEEGADAAQVLEERLKGMALAAKPPTEALTQQMGELKEAIGFAVREALDFDNRVEVLTGRIAKLATNTELIGRLVRELVRAMRDLATIVGVLIGVRGLMALRTAMLAAGSGVEFLTLKLRALSLAMGPVGWLTLAISGVIILFNRLRDAAKEAAIAAQEALDLRNAALQSVEVDKVREALEAAQQSLARMRDIERDMAQQRRRTTQEFRDKLKAEEQAVEALSRRYVELLTRRDEAMTPATDAPSVATEAIAEQTRRTIGPVRVGELLGLGRAELDQARIEAFVATLAPISTALADQQVKDALRLRDEAFAAMQEAALDTAHNMTNAFAGFFEGMAQGFLGTMTLADAFRQGVAGIGGALIEELTKGKAELHMAEAAGALARGTWPPNPLALKAASQHLIAAGLFRALPGIVRGMGRSSGASRPSIPNAMAATRPSAMAERMLPEINIYIDPLNPTNPAWQSTLAQTLRGVRQRYGSATVNVRPRTA